MPEISSVDDLRRVGADTVAWSVESFTEPRSWWVASDGSAPRRTALGTRTPIDLSGFTVRRVFATSADGTQVPINLIARADVEPGAPTLLYGYGGYAISMKPSFSPARLQWLEQGHVFAVANIRGGGEYGVAWHHGGRLHDQAELLRRLHRLRRPPRRDRGDHPRQAGDHGRLERRAADGRGAHAAARPRRGGGLRRAGARRHPLGDDGQRSLQRDRVRHRRGPGRVRGAARLLALPPGARRGRLPAGAVHRRRVRPPRRGVARQEDGRPPAGGDVQRRSRCCCAWSPAATGSGSRSTRRSGW